MTWRYFFNFVEHRFAARCAIVCAIAQIDREMAQGSASWATGSALAIESRRIELDENHAIGIVAGLAQAMQYVVSEA